MGPSIPSTHTYLLVSRYDVISKPEAQQAVGIPARDVPQRMDRTPLKTKEEARHQTHQSPDCLSAIIVSGLGDEGLIGLAEQFNEARIRMCRAAAYLIYLLVTP